MKTEITEPKVIKQIEINQLTKEEKNKLKSQVNLDKLGDKDN